MVGTTVGIAAGGALTVAVATPLPTISSCVRLSSTRLLCEMYPVSSLLLSPPARGLDELLLVSPPPRGLDDPLLVSPPPPEPGDALEPDVDDPPPGLTS